MKNYVFKIETLLILFLLGSCLSLIFFYAPIEAQMGIIQKIFYFHVPAAYSMYLSWIVCTVCSILYITKKQDKFDMLATSSADISLLFAVMVMTTGPLWGRKSWGAYWVWDPRLTTALILSLIIVSYVLLRRTKQDEATKRFSGAIAIIGALMIPLIHVSVNKWRGQHPAVLKSGGLEPKMLITFLICMVSFTIIYIIILKNRYTFEKLSRAYQKKQQEIALNRE